MSQSAPLTASAVIPIPDAITVQAKLCEHLREHAEVTITDNRAEIVSYYGRADLTAERETIAVALACETETELSVMKTVVAQHLVEFAGDKVGDFRWSGADADRRDLPYLRELTVVSAHQLTPRMRRVLLRGHADHYDSTNYHVRVLIAPKGRPPVWPSAAADGRMVWPTGEDALTPRVYTIRSVDRARDEVTIDVVLHDGSPGTEWAVNAAAGDPVGLLGPGGGGDAPDADAYVFAGDETAIPAIARMLETLPADARAIVRVEIADAAEEQPLASPAALDLVWLHRNGAPAGTTDYLDTAVRALDWAALPERTFVFGAGEQTTARAIRRFLDKEIGLDKSRRMVAAYWRLGAASAE